MTFRSPSPFARPRRLGSRAGSRGFTFLEMLVALAIAMTFLAALYTSFITMLRTMDRNRARLDAIRNGRTAIMTMFDEFKQISAQNATFVPILIGLNNDTATGDGVDNDGDGRVDEEIIDGRDSDGDYTAAADELHVPLGPNIVERYMYSDAAPFGFAYPDVKDDLGDLHVDEDQRYGRDIVQFRITPATPILDVLFRTITYSIGTFDGQNNVLIRQARTEFTPVSNRQPIISTAPLAFNCLGLDFMYWDANGNPAFGTPRAQRPYWVTQWDSTDAANFDPPKLPLPASIFIRVNQYASPQPFQNYVAGRPVEAIPFSMIVNLEETIGDTTYPRPVI